VVSHYRLLDPLASGGMGVVYRAEDTELGRTVALKFLPPQIIHDPRRKERFREEARTASALNHPNICTIYEVGEEQGELFIAMEYVEGRPLSEYIRGEGMTVSRVLWYGKQIAAALEHAHSRGVIHRDLKPLNIIVTPEGNAKILDFGLAKRSDPGEVTRKSLQAGPTETSPGLAGTMPYMSPEQLEGKEATVRSDIWSLGVVLYEMASGLRPFGGENLYRLCIAIIQEPLPPLPGNVPPGLAAVIQRCLEKDPARRYHRASEVRAALEALEPSSAVSIVSPAPTRRALTVALWAISILAVAGMATGGTWLVKKNRFARGRSPAEAHPLQMQLAVLLPEASALPGESAFDSGLVETLTSSLTGLTEHHPLAVVPASEIRSRHVQTLDAARQEFGVNCGLVLNIQRAAGQVRVNYSLVDARSHQVLRGGTVTAAVADPFALQDQVSAQVVETLKLQLEPQEKKALSAHGTAEPAAYDFYLQGRGYLQNFDKMENLENAIAVFRRALEKDPNFSAAYAGLGEAYWLKYQLTHDVQLVKEAADSCIQAAKADASLAVAHTCLGFVYNGTGKYEEAAAEFEKASVLEPTLDDAAAGRARAYVNLKRLDDAEKAYRKAIALRPNYWANYNRLGNFYLMQGRSDEAAQMYSQVISLVPDSFVGYNNLGLARLQQARYAEAVPLLERSLEIRKTSDATSNLGTAYFALHRYADAAHAYEQAAALNDKNFIVWGNLGDAYYWTPGRRGEAPSAYRKAIAIAGEALRVNKLDADTNISVAVYHAMLGEREPAFSALRLAMAAAPNRPDFLLDSAIIHEQFGEHERALDALEKAVAAGVSPVAVRDTPNFEGLRSNPRYVSIVSRMHSN
jgi:serine/threonine protein kinase/tetratricopeptide (TPR) repeat protein